MDLPNPAPPDRHHRFAAFDIGGTWFRSGRVDIDTMSASSMKQRPAISWSAHPELPPEDLERRLVDWLACEARRLIGEGGGRAAVSLGAAMNEQSGWVHGSGPLWGPRSKPFDLLARLQEAAPDLSWTVVNDLTAAILQASRHVAPEDRKMMLVTVSSGVAARILDRRSARLPAEEATGLQGEIGHLPVAPLRAFGHEITLDCACGGRSHLAAYCSGQGILKVLNRLSALDCAAFLDADALETDEDRLAAFVTELAALDADAIRLLDALVEPIAAILRTALVLDPEIDRIVLTGGVVEGLGQVYLERLLARLDGPAGLYVVKDLAPDYFARRITILTGKEANPLFGAVLAALRPVAA